MLVFALFVALAAPPDPPSTTIVMERVAGGRIDNRTFTCSHNKPVALMTAAEKKADKIVWADKLWCSVVATEVDAVPGEEPKRCVVGVHPLFEPIELAPTPDGKAWQTVTTYQSRCGAVDAVLGPTPGARAKTWHVVEKVVGPSSSSADCAGGAPAEFRSDRKPTAMKCEQIDLCGSCTLR